ncbi:DUF805 domain-containing protein [Parasediminibacterium sp. JCM 36343]|uniref:DUF805 domain-containing protein n=1 Tax=Parasediminibacterium sp. JCM 36343 TaxID=3374279 RepID=UPI003979451A
MKWYLIALKKYAVFHGRARRSEYWYFILFTVLALIASSFIDVTISSVFKKEYPYGVANLICILGSFIPWLAVLCRRLHDVNKSGGNAFIWLIPLIGPIWLLVLLFTEGTPGPNKYGEDPKQPELYEEINQIGSNIE